MMNMMKWHILILLLFVFIACGDDDSKSEGCDPACNGWEICNGTVCELKSGFCKSKSDCSDTQICNDQHICEDNVIVCDPVCDEWKVCNSGSCELKSGRCDQKSDCGDTQLCNDQHQCEDEIITCEPACKVWESCNKTVCEVKAGFCNSKSDCSDPQICDEADHLCKDTRPFYMGFTTWSYDPTPDSVSDLIDRVTGPEYGDIVALHYMDGVPWDYGHDGVYPPQDIGPYYPESIQKLITDRIQNTAPLKVIYLAIDPLNSKRNGIADRMYDQEGKLSREPFSTYSFNDSRAQNSYINFTLYTLYQIYTHYTTNSYPLPKIYYNYSSEASDLILAALNKSDGTLDLTEWNNYKLFAKAVFDTLKGYQHIDSGFQQFVREIPLMVSIVLRSPADEIADNIVAPDGEQFKLNDPSELLQKHFSEILAWTDMIGISSYGYIFYDHQFKDYPEDHHRGDPDNLPQNWLTQIETIAPGKPYGITETGWLADSYDVDGDGAGVYTIIADADDQKRYLERLFADSQQINLQFLIWFTLIDYDPLWYLPLEQGGMNRDRFGLTWLKTGLFDNSADSIELYNSDGVVVTPRSGWDLWKSWLSRWVVQE